MPPTDQPARDVPATSFTFNGPAPRSSERAVAVETAVNIVYGTVPYAVMMTTPDDLVDFAVGFSLTEGVIQARTDIRGVRVEAAAGGLRLIVDLVPARLHGLLARRRAMAGRTGCGVCGIEDLADLPRVERQRLGRPVRLDAIARALADLEHHQGLNAATRAVHAAAWAEPDGRIVCVREDVGRHNALDKLVGALLSRGTEPAAGFVLITSRCSYEMVEKAAAFGAGTLVAISAPTSLGIERASQHGIVLIGIARHDGITAFTGADRILVQEPAIE
jgi:FdhD protein